MEVTALRAELLPNPSALHLLKGSFKNGNEVVQRLVRLLTMKSANPGLKKAEETFVLTKMSKAVTHWYSRF